MILTLEYHRSTARYLAGRTVTGAPSAAGRAARSPANLSPLRLVTRPDPQLPGDGWTRVKPLLSGICGSDLGLLTGRNSPYLSAVISMPFTPGHEVVGETLDDAARHAQGQPGGDRPGARLPAAAASTAAVVRRRPAQPLRPHHHRRRSRPASRPASAPTPAAAGAGCSSRTAASCTPCRTTSDHRSGGAGRAARLRDPLGAPGRGPATAPASLVVGAGTVGLLTVLALREYTKVGPIYVVAKHGHQRERARELGATEVLSRRPGGPGAAPRHRRRSWPTRSAATSSCSAASTSPSSAPAAPGWTRRCGWSGPAARCVLSGMPNARRRPDPGVVPRAAARRGVRLRRAGLPDAIALAAAGAARRVRRRGLPAVALARGDRPRQRRRAGSAPSKSRSTRPEGLREEIE